MQLRYTYANELQDLCSVVKAQLPYKLSLAVHNSKLAEALDIASTKMSTEWWSQQLSDPESPLQRHAIAQKYGGHQFGHWNPYLGDGRGLLLAEICDKNGKWHDLHLKGSGQTPYSRHADGRAVLRSSIREYIASEAMHGLGIPTSRALCLFNSDDPVKREQLETAAMLIRTCASHIRFGHFEYFHHSGDTSALDSLFEYCFEHLFANESQSSLPHADMLQTIVNSTADLIAGWQAIGFNHGIMNTDNMSILGITFDYGPYAFLDDYMPNFSSNKSDHTSRYSFEQQPAIGLWNLNALAQAFTRYVSADRLTAILTSFQPRLTQAFYSKIHAKLGLDNVPLDIDENRQRVDALTTAWFQLLQEQRLDYTQSFRSLAYAHTDPGQMLRNIKNPNSIKNWLTEYVDITQQWPKSIDQLNAINPAIVPRNHHLQTVIDAAETGDFNPIESLMVAIENPYEINDATAHWSKMPAPNNKGIALSCSS